MTQPESLRELYLRRLARTRDPELKRLLTELGNEIERQTSANRIAYLAINDIYDGWMELGVLEKKEEESG